jgi:hypothetical protein
MHSPTVMIKVCLNSVYKVHVGKNLFDYMYIRNGLKQLEVLWPLLFNFGLEYYIRKIHENHMKLKLNGTYQLLAYADDVNLL